MIIRREAPGDAKAIAAVVEEAFGQPEEARLVEALRRDGDAEISLVAEADGRIAGHILFSPMSAPFPALGLAPLSVGPGHQRKGVGAALIQEGLRAASGGPWQAIFVLGDPAYYGRFGFRADLAEGYASPYAGPHLMVRALGGGLPVTTGAIEYAPAFAAL